MRLVIAVAGDEATVVEAERQFTPVLVVDPPVMRSGDLTDSS